MPDVATRRQHTAGRVKRNARIVCLQVQTERERESYRRNRKQLSARMFFSAKCACIRKEDSQARSTQIAFHIALERAANAKQQRRIFIRGNNSIMIMNVGDAQRRDTNEHNKKTYDMQSVSHTHTNTHRDSTTSTTTELPG